MYWLCIYISTIILVGNAASIKYIILAIIYIQCKILTLTWNINNIFNPVLTNQEQIMFKIANTLTQTTIEIWILIIIIIYILWKRENEFKIVKIVDRTIYMYINILCIMVTLSYVEHVHNITNKIDMKSMYPLYQNSLVAIHPPVLLCSLLTIMIINNISMVGRNNKKVYLKKINIIKMHNILLIAIILGGIWASYLFGWGGFWIWDPIETIIVIHLYFIINWIHKKEKNTINSNIYTIWYISYSKTNIINGLHSFNIINWINTKENLIWWLNIYIMQKIWKKKKEKWNNISTYNIYMIYIPIIIIVINNMNEQVGIQEIIFVPTNICNILIWYVLLVHIIKKCNKKNRINWMIQRELCIMIIYATKICLTWWIEKICIIYLATINTLVTMVTAREKNKYIYIKDHIVIYVVLLLIIVYISLYSGEKIELKTHIIQLTGKNIYMEINKEQIQKINDEIEIDSIIIGKNKGLSMLKKDKDRMKQIAQIYWWNWETNILGIDKKMEICIGNWVHTISIYNYIINILIVGSVLQIIKTIIEKRSIRKSMFI